MGPHRAGLCSYLLIMLVYHAFGIPQMRLRGLPRYDIRRAKMRILYYSRLTYLGTGVKKLQYRTRMPLHL